MEQTDYKELYKQEKERAKYNLTYAQVEEIVPEPESEDERIRKDLIIYLRSILANKKYGDKFIESWIDWLEKQGEKTSDKIVEKARTEKQRVLLTETDGSANIDWDCRSLDDVKTLLKCGLEFIRTIEADKQILTDSRFGGCSIHVPTRYDKGIKQGEQILANSAKNCKDEQKPIKERNVCDFCEDRYGCVNHCPMKLIEEEKPADKVESKFYEGDWVVYDHRVYQVVELPKEGYINLGLRRNGKIEFAPSTYCRHWTIQDAREGDVLYLQKDGKEHIIIYKGVIKERFRTFVSAYCAYNGIVDAFCFADVSRYVDIAYGGIMPASKEQRDFLFQKMKEAGYMWDTENKQLLSLKAEPNGEQKPANNVEPKFREGDSIQFKGFGHNRYTIKEVCGLSHYINTMGNSMDMSYTDANFEVIKDPDKVEISTVWSEEDERIRKSLSAYFAKFKPDDMWDADFSFGDIVAWFENQGKKGTKGNDREIPFDAWSEEDERMSRFIGNAITADDSSIYLKSKGIQVIDAHIWLGNLKNRVQPLLKQEWSEEDGNHVKSILSTIECCKAQFPNAKAVVEAYNADIDWFKSLKNRYIWKPSDLPHWKKSTLPDSNTTGFNSDYFCHKGYCINYKELFEKLPKDD